jgi:pilus assembly protein Flp/PilA
MASRAENEMAGRFWTFARDDNAATAIEYALMAALLALAVIIPLGSIGTKLSSYFSEASSALK